MIFLFKKKPIHVDFFTGRADVYECAPMDYAKNFIPDWWKNLPKVPANSNQTANMRYCAGFNELYKRGVILPLWSDMNIMVGGLGTKQGGYQYSDTLSKADFHGAPQRGEFAPDSMHIKLISRCAAKCKEDVPFLAIGTQYNQQSLGDYVLANGILEFKHQHALNVNLMFTQHAAERHVYMQHGEPLMHLIPLEERKVVIHNHLANPNEMEMMKQSAVSITFQAKYYKRAQIANRKEKKCPFSGD